MLSPSIESPKTLAEHAGTLVGLLLAPFTALVSAARRARTFHPEGVVYRGVVGPVAEAEGGPFAALARRLEGPVIARASTALWRGGREWMDALGLALRFRDGGEAPASAEPSEGDQDLLFATIRHPWTTPFAPLTTRVHDFLANDYYAVSPFFADGVGRVEFRLVSPRTARPGAPGARRDELLARDVAEGRACFELEVRALERGAPWTPVAVVRLVERVSIDDDALRFSPFREGRGIRPVGFVHALRRAAYAASQQARPSHA
jgi:hypothetical protein